VQVPRKGAARQLSLGKLAQIVARRKQRELAPGGADVCAEMYPGGAGGSEGQNLSAITFAPGALGLHGIRYSEEISTIPVFASQADLHSSNELSKAG
jgi:hypothetical protein